MTDLLACWCSTVGRPARRGGSKQPERPGLIKRPRRGGWGGERVAAGEQARAVARAARRAGVALSRRQGW